VVTIEDGDKLAPGLTQCVVQVAGFGAGAFRSREVLHAGLRCELAKLAARSVVQQDYVELVRRPIHLHRRKYRVANHIQRFVQGRDQHIDHRPSLRIFGHDQRGRLSGAMLWKNPNTRITKV